MTLKSLPDEIKCTKKIIKTTTMSATTGVVQVEVHCVRCDRKIEPVPGKLPEEDSGLDNTSESGNSSDLPFSSIESVDEISTIVEEETILSTSPFDSNFIPDSIRLLFEGQDIPADFSVPLNSRPDWLDMEKFKRGQKFARDHFFCICYAEMLSLATIFSIKAALQPLIFTRNSDTPVKAFKRYLSTITRVKSWYEEDVWSENSAAYTHMRTVRALHKNVHSRLSACSSEELLRRTESFECPVWSTSNNFLLEDFQSACPIPHPSMPSFRDRIPGVTQTGMYATQFAFVGLAVTFPKFFGIHFASNEDLEAFIHTWRGLGYLLGIKDEFNFCKNDLQGVRQTTKDLIKHIIKPSFRHINPQWEHMTRCYIRGISYYLPGVSFEISIKDLCELLHLHIPRFTKELSIRERLMHKTYRFTLENLFRVPGMLSFCNGMVWRAIKWAQTVSQGTIEKWEKNQFTYAGYCVAHETIDTKL